MREILSEYGLEDSIIFENPDYDEAIVGYTDSGNVVYDYEMMVECLVREGMTWEEAVEWIDYNTVRALGYCEEPKPIILYKFD